MRETVTPSSTVCHSELSRPLPCHWDLSNNELEGPLPEFLVDLSKERIEEIGQQDESSKVLSPNDSIAQVFGKERPGRVRGVGSGPTPSQLFGLNSHVTVNGVQVEETQRKLLELQAELEGEKLKRKVMEDEAAVEKKKRQAMKSALIYLYQQQGEELPPEIAVGISSVD
ncbi:uncharacterized protein LOC107605205 isoform X1 [Arachis ipaensis]|uniref:uncharacterized protein LOC107605205 isoform X1 n=1 Tax=Arachis ipaensis TaxID=130454 RepID=UPI000A2B7068|nr:uncharacterized protein LOC107605205 isoform X1 [Arachis ipaensis]XP_025659265.1 uncharacterized protein LOC112755406 isoform X1 [Arachis hypogaea]